MANHWLHVTASHVHYSVHEKRGILAMDAAGNLPNFTGVAVHDHWKPYWHYPCQHALCNAHHLRELRYCEQLTGDDWSITLRLLLELTYNKVITFVVSLSNHYSPSTGSGRTVL